MTDAVMPTVESDNDGSPSLRVPSFEFVFLPELRGEYRKFSEAFLTFPDPTQINEKIRHVADLHTATKCHCANLDESAEHTETSCSSSSSENLQACRPASRRGIYPFGAQTASVFRDNRNRVRSANFKGSGITHFTRSISSMVVNPRRLFCSVPSSDQPFDGDFFDLTRVCAAHDGFADKIVDLKYFVDSHAPEVSGVVANGAALADEEITVISQDFRRHVLFERLKFAVGDTSGSLTVRTDHTHEPLTKRILTVDPPERFHPMSHEAGSVVGESLVELASIVPVKAR